MRSLSLKVGLAIAISFGLLALLSPFLVSEPIPFRLGERLCTPSPSHLLGCDEDGRDLLALIFVGTRASLGIGLFGVLLGVAIGTLLGLWSGYRGGGADTLFLWLSDSILSFPTLLLVIAFAAFYRDQTFLTLTVLFGGLGWVSFARLVRGGTLSLKEREFVLASRISGASFLRLCRFHLMPQLMGPILVQAACAVGGFVLAESSLSFLGLGLSPEVPSWGRLLDQGVQYLLIAPHLSLFPGLAIALLVVAFQLIAEGFRKKFHLKEGVE